MKFWYLKTENSFNVFESILPSPATRFWSDAELKGFSGIYRLNSDNFFIWNWFAFALSTQKTFHIIYLGKPFVERRVVVLFCASMITGYVFWVLSQANLIFFLCHAPYKGSLSFHIMVKLSSSKSDIFSLR